MVLVVCDHVSVGINNLDDKSSQAATFIFKIAGHSNIALVISSGFGGQPGTKRSSHS